MSSKSKFAQWFNGSPKQPVEECAQCGKTVHTAKMALLQDLEGYRPSLGKRYICRHHGKAVAGPSEKAVARAKRRVA